VLVGTVLEKTVRLKKYINNNKNVRNVIYNIDRERDFDCIVADRKKFVT